MGILVEQLIFGVNPAETEGVRREWISGVCKLQIAKACPELVEGIALVFKPRISRII